MASIEITGLDHAALLAALYNAAQPVGLGAQVAGSGSDLTADEVRRLLDDAPTVTVREVPPADRPYRDVFGNLLVGYLRGRPLHIMLSETELECDGYDRTHGAGTADQVVAHLRHTGGIAAPESKLP